MILHRHCFAGARISCHSSFSLFHFKTSETADLNILSVAQRSDDSLNETVNNRFCFNFGQTGSRCYNVYDICFRHDGSPLLWKIIPILNDRLVEQFVFQSGQF